MEGAWSRRDRRALGRKKETDETLAAPFTGALSEPRPAASCPRDLTAGEEERSRGDVLPKGLEPDDTIRVDRWALYPDSGSDLALENVLFSSWYHRGLLGTLRNRSARRVGTE